MKKVKTLLSKMKSSAPEVDALLLPRLKFMGFLLLVFSFASLCYAFFEDDVWMMSEVQTSPSLREVDPENTWHMSTLIEVENTYLLSPYLAATAFAVTGLYCLFYVRQKKKNLSIPLEIPETEENQLDV